MKLGIVLLRVRDIGRSAAFYGDKLGLELQRQFPGFAFFHAGGIDLGLTELAAARQQDQPLGETELVFTVDDVHREHARLKGAGIDFLNEPRTVDGTNFAANFRDPDGHLLSIYGPPGPHTDR